jgi:hypothetical protein
MQLRQSRIGPENPGVSRVVAARLMLVVIAGFYVAGLVFVFLYGLGVDPFAVEAEFDWPWIG